MRWTNVLAPQCRTTTSHSPTKALNEERNPQMTPNGSEQGSLDKRPYIAVTNELFRHPKFVRISDKAKVHLIELWAYCNEYRTDGIVHESILNGKGAAVTKILRSAGWVDDTTEPDMFYMHDYLDHQRSKNQIEASQKDKAAAGSQGGKKSSHMRNHVKKGVYDPTCEWCGPAEPTQ